MSDDFSKEYSESSFWEKVKSYAKSAGESVIEPAIKMYYSAQDTDTPTWAKGTIYGALGYFISPIDAIPDMTPVAGYTDDLGVLVAAVAMVASHIKEEHAVLARSKLEQWFG